MKLTYETFETFRFVTIIFKLILIKICYSDYNAECVKTEKPFSLLDPKVKESINVYNHIFKNQSEFFLLVSFNEFNFNGFKVLIPYY